MRLPTHGGIELQRFDFVARSPTRLTFHPSHDMFPVRSQDGARIASATRPTFTNLYEVRATARKRAGAPQDPAPRVHFLFERRQIPAVRQRIRKRGAISGSCPWTARARGIPFSTKRLTSVRRRFPRTVDGWRTSRTRASPTRSTFRRSPSRDSNGRFLRRQVAASSRSGDATARNSSTWRAITR